MAMMLQDLVYPYIQSVLSYFVVKSICLFISQMFSPSASYKTALEKITEGMKSLINMAGSQNNKLSKINLSLKSFDGALQNLEGDAYKLQRQNERAIEDLTCSVAQSEEALEDLCEVKDCITEIQETLDQIEGFVHPCKGSGWIEVVNITYIGENAQPCPHPWEPAEPGCGRDQPGGTSSFDAVQFPVGDGVQYNEVCGRIHGERTLEGIGPFQAFVDSSATISGQYVDGIAVTINDGGLVHIWTFAVSESEAPGSDIDNFVDCPCDGGTTPPIFVGQNYFCEADNFPDDILWDGEDCVSEVCCTRANPPYFNAYLDSPTTAPIDVTMILSHTNADIGITHIELYVR